MSHADQPPYIRGRWMVTGPNYPDGTGWSLCQQVDGKCQRCVAEFSLQDDAELAAAVLADHETLGSTTSVATREAT